MADWTIRALMEWTEKHFQEKGIDAPRLEAQLLLAHALTCKRVEIYTRWDEPVAEERRGRFRDLIKRRLDGCPTMYLVGRREFFALEFEVTPAVLIPRPETEILVAETLKRSKSIANPRVLDVGTGSGCIAVAIAHRQRNAQVTAIDISAEALDVARRNAAKHGVADRIRFLHGDLFGPLAADEKFDVIISNPPYVTTAEWERLPSHIREHEPRLALEAGPDGFAVYDRLIPDASDYLVPSGHLLLEIGATQEEGVGRRLRTAGTLEAGPVLRDDQAIPRIATARRLAV